ncbi:MAG: acyl carrier protein [Clostridia bacterium]|nr:acyl carrier protein [Clostridia bacterium]MBR5422807.1 acyl carrier protein [Clostridia bacterium]
MDMLAKMREIICEFVDMDPEAITLETNIRTDLGLNSLELVNLAVEIEEEFEVEIPDREAMGLETVADAIRIIEEYMD